jgi:hypothetical protein
LFYHYHRRASSSYYTAKTQLGRRLPKWASAGTEASYGLNVG